MNFSDICLTGTSAVGIGSSVLLTITFPEVVINTFDDEPT
jgi:hypothetical protein